MALKQINVDWSQVKSYATEKALAKRIEADRALYPEYNDRFIVTRTPDGRWTAIVQLDTSKGGYVGRYEFLKL